MRWLESLSVKKPADYALFGGRASIAIRSINQKKEKFYRYFALIRGG
jgi:hypothetical protein